ncbi:MAG TPA: photosystem I reaction center subunit PsaK [Leptolyngbyaceae cyanobacterium M33_DOE_097]|uniref:Photosystem I reaction center subunit PsaK n=1 Tax=Oscillatoriales cyanobacterium SpSt-418 TaxID=2282169 RepID=A0A7C3KHY6_9CYAN|nr:photosystem I reaction center subunit PsaK [Leptolyngbyaceae cyanobacterium M33_DOE_097]
MLNSTLLLAVAAKTSAWSPGVGLTMILCNLFAIAIGRFAIQKKGIGPKLPIELPDPFGGEFGVPELLATASFGHLLGAGVILGLSNAGVL